MASAKKYSFLAAAGRMLVDMTWIGLAYLSAVAMTVPEGASLTVYALGRGLWLLVFVLLWCGVAVDQGLFTSRRSEALISVLFSSAKAFLTTLLIVTFLLAVLAPGEIGRAFLLAFGVSGLVMSLLSMLVARPSIWKLRRRGYGFRRILIIGSNARTAHLVEVLLANEHYGYHIAGFLEDDPERRSLLERFGVHWLGGIQALEKILVEHVVDGVYITLPVRSFYETVRSIAHLCEGVGVPVRLLADLFPLRMAASDVIRLGDIPMLSLTSEAGILTRFALKRGMDLIASLALLAVLSPILVVIAILVKLSSKGPVFVLQDRLGQGLQPFKMLSFRVLHSGGAAGAARSFTPLGRFLHRYGLDELPQAVNVVMGHMSLAGTRPLVLAQPDHGTAPTGTPQRPRPEKLGRFPISGGSTDATVEAGNGEASHFSKTRSILPLAVLALLDAFCIVLAYCIAIWRTSPLASVVPYSLVNYLPYLLIFILVWSGSAIDRRLWTTRFSEGLESYLVAVSKAVGDALVICVFIMVLFTPEGLPRDFLVTFCFATLLVLLAFRFSIQALFAQVHRAGYDLRRVVIVGANPRTSHLISTLESHRGLGYMVGGVFDDVPERAKFLKPLNTPYAGTTATLSEALDSGNVDEVYVSLPFRSQYEAIQAIAQKCESAAVPVHLVADFFPVQIAKSRLMMLEDIPLLSLSPICEAHLQLALKRFIDFVGSSVLIVALSPLLLALAVLIKLDSRGPVFFRQERVGQNQRRFRMIKFRSMIANAEELKKAVEALNEADGPVFKIKRDPRITRIGAYLRRFSLDELPQLFNVWVAEMSLVGPRPPIPAEVEKYTWSQRRRLSVKPGMTGLWQVSGRSDVSFKEWVEMDLSYIDTWSLWQDLAILLRTFKVVVTGRGAA
jgi:exopolysaccharide biosynthesis polyprenyl glycosylphosphotransferase